MLCDFGVSLMILSSQTLTSTTGGVKGSLRWMAPELLTGATKHTAETDVWAFGMTIYVSTPTYIQRYRETHFLFINRLPPTGISSKRVSLRKYIRRSTSTGNDPERRQTHPNLYRSRSPSQHQYMGQPLRRRQGTSQPRRPALHGAQRNPSLEPLQKMLGKRAKGTHTHVLRHRLP